MTTAIDPIPAATGRAVVVYVAHQDDETLWFWMMIAHHVLAGRTVIIVLGTDGSTSTIIKSINGETSNGWWGGYHYPAREQYPAPLSPQQFAEARDREFVNAGVQLGVRVENVRLEIGTRKSTISVTEAEQLIRRYQAEYPDAGHYTHWWGDTDPNHSAMGTALRNLALEEPDKFFDCRWMVRRTQGPTAPGAVEYVVPSTLKAQVLHMGRCAAQAYSAWGPLQNLFAIGYHSVPSEFAAVEQGQSTWIVKQP